MKRVLICFTIPGDGGYQGGIATIVKAYLDNASLFKSNGYDVSLFDYHPNRMLPRRFQRINNVVYGLKQIAAIRRILKTTHYDVVHIHTSREFLFVKDTILARIIDSFGARVILTIHVGSYDTVFNRIHFLEKWSLGILNNRVDKTLFLSQSIKTEFINNGLIESRAGILYNFHCLPEIMNSEEEASHSGLRLLYVGAIHREKGILELLDAMIAINDKSIVLDICGIITDESIKSEFDNRIQLLCGRVSLHGYVKGIEKSQLFHNADILVLPSYHEGMPMVILEALSSSCAIISTRVGATPEILSDENAMWVDIGNSTDIVNSICSLNSNRGLLQFMKNNNRILSLDFSIGSHINRLCNYYSIDNGKYSI